MDLIDNNNIEDLEKKTITQDSSDKLLKQVIDRKSIPISISIVKGTENPSDKRPDFECEKCGDVFAAKSNLQRHMIGRHSNIRDFECEKCHYA